MSDSRGPRGLLAVHTDDLSSTGGDPALDRAWRELRRVHATELAWLLREGARMALSRSETAPEAWRAGLREALDCVRLDRLVLDPPVERILERCLSAGSGPGAGELVEASLRLEECAEGRRLLESIQAGRVSVAPVG